MSVKNEKQILNIVRDCLNRKTGVTKVVIVVNPDGNVSIDATSSLSLSFDNDEESSELEELADEDITMISFQTDEPIRSEKIKEETKTANSNAQFAKKTPIVLDAPHTTMEKQPSAPVSTTVPKQPKQNQEIEAVRKPPLPRQEPPKSELPKPQQAFRATPQVLTPSANPVSSSELPFEPDFEAIVQNMQSAETPAPNNGVPSLNELLAQYQ